MRADMCVSRSIHAWLDVLRKLLMFHINPIGLGESSVARKRSQFLTFYVSCTHCEDMMFIHTDQRNLTSFKTSQTKITRCCGLKADLLYILHRVKASLVFCDNCIILKISFKNKIALTQIKVWSNIFKKFKLKLI